MKEDIAGNYFIKPKRAAQLLNQSKSETSKAFNTWRGNHHFSSFQSLLIITVIAHRFTNLILVKGVLSVTDFAKKNKLQAGEPPTQNGLTVHSSPNVLSNSYGGISSLWLNGKSKRA